MEEKTKEINLKVLRMKDPLIESLEYVCKYCIIHEFDRAVNIWHACEMAGPLFLVRKRETKQVVVGSGK